MNKKFPEGNAKIASPPSTLIFFFFFFFFSAFLLSEPHIVITIQSYTSTVLMCLLQIQCSRDDVHVLSCTHQDQILD